MPEKQGDIDEVGLLTRAKKTYILLFDRVLKEWLRVTSLGGIIAFTHKVFPLKKPLVAIRLPLAMPFLPRLIWSSSSPSSVVTITCAFQSLVLDAWEKEQKELEEQRLWKLIYRWDSFKSVDPTTYICIFIQYTYIQNVII